MKRILWVEDEKEHYEALSFFLKKSYGLIRAADYTDALNKISAENYALYIIDMIMPSGKTLVELSELSKISTIYYGVELIKKVRKKDSNVPIIVLSVVASQKLVENIKALDKRIVYLSKYDCDPNEILAIVESMMKEEG